MEKNITITIKPNMKKVKDSNRVEIIQKNKASITIDKSKVIPRKKKYNKILIEEV